MSSWVGSFVDSVGRAVSIMIEDSSLTADKEMTLSALSISCEAGDHKYTSCRSISATMRVVTDEMMSSIYTTSPIGRPVIISRDGSTIFRGYVTPSEWQSPMTGVNDEVEIVAVDTMTAYKLMPYIRINRGGHRAVTDIISILIRYAKTIGMSSIIIPSGRSSAWRAIQVTEDAFLPANIFDGPGSQDWLAWTDVVGYIALQFGCICYTVDTTLYLLPPDMTNSFVALDKWERVSLDTGGYTDIVDGFGLVTTYQSFAPASWTPGGINFTAQIEPAKLIEFSVRRGDDNVISDIFDEMAFGCDNGDHGDNIANLPQSTQGDYSHTMFAELNGYLRYTSPATSGWMQEQKSSSTGTAAVKVDREFFHVIGGGQIDIIPAAWRAHPVARTIAIDAQVHVNSYSSTILAPDLSQMSHNAAAVVCAIDSAGNEIYDKRVTQSGEWWYVDENGELVYGSTDTSQDFVGSGWVNCQWRIYIPAGAVGLRLHCERVSTYIGDNIVEHGVAWVRSLSVSLRSANNLDEHDSYTMPEEPNGQLDPDTLDIDLLFSDDRDATSYMTNYEDNKQAIEKQYAKPRNIYNIQLYQPSTLTPITTIDIRGLRCNMLSYTHDLYNNVAQIAAIESYINDDDDE